MQLAGSRTRRLVIVCGLTAAVVALAFYYFSSMSLNTAVIAIKAWQSDPLDYARIAKMVADSQPAATDLSVIEKKCQMYVEFRRLNFQHPDVRRILCHDIEAYKQYDGTFPLCQLQNPFNEDMLNIVRQASDIVGLLDMRNVRLQMFVYKGSDMISESVRHQGTWEPNYAHFTLRFALKLPDVTFLDIGSNIGVYSLQAASLGLPVVSMDANIRNLLRLQLSLRAASLKTALVWGFIAPDQNLKYLSFFADCNVGGAGRDKSDLPDTVPIMPLKSERICDLIKTKNVVMKMDIQGAETDFLVMSGRLFTDFNVAAVQMEWYPPMIRGNDSIVLANFFTTRGYKGWNMAGFKPLNLSDIPGWGMIEIVWIRNDFIRML